MSTTLPTWPLWFYIPAALLAALGLIGLYCSLFKGRHKGRLRCPKCWYDMKGAALPARCPECGTTANTLKDLQRTRRHWWHAIAALLLILPLGVVFAKIHATKVYYAVMPKWKLADRYESGLAAVKVYTVRDPDDRGTRVVVTDDGKQILDRDDYSASVTGYNFAHQPFVDLNNDGNLECVAEFYSGGAHCCYRVFIIECLPTGAVIVADIDAQNGLSIKTPAVSGGEQSIAITDSTFNYWKTSYAAAPKPLVFYRLHDHALRVDLDRMDAAVTAAAADAYANESAVVAFGPASAEPLPILWSTTLDILLAGHEPQAWAFFDRTWGDRAGKEDFRREFQKVLATDPFYQDLIVARAARAAGKPIPPSIVGMNGRAADAAESTR